MTDIRRAGVTARGSYLAVAFAAIALVGLATSSSLGCNGRNHPGQTGDTAPNADSGAATESAPRYEIDLFAFGRQLGTIAPCGCTTEPLGGLQYAFGYIEAESSAGQRLILEPGSFLFPDPDGPEGPTDEAAWAQAVARAELLQGRFSALDGLVSGLGPTDYASSKSGAALAELPLPRVVANLGKDARPAGVERVRVVPLGHGLSAAVTQVIDPAVASAAAGKDWGKQFPAVTEPIAALVEIAPELAKAQLQVVMVNGPRELAETIAREVEGIDVVVVGAEFTNPDRGRVGSSAVQIGTTWVLEPGDRAQTISHLTISLDPSLPAGQLPDTWTLIPSTEQREAELARLEQKLSKFADDKTADARFVARLEAERDQLKAALASPAIPSDVPVALIPAQVKVTCHLPADATSKLALSNYDAAVAERNRERFAGVEPPPPAPGQAGYAGIEACADCHSEAVDMWKTTVHARAYETLVTANKQFDLSCVNCHVTGFRAPGGSEVVENQHLQSVQCEQCHGPGSLHVEDPSTDNIQLSAPVSVCLTCHTPEHSDTFDYEPYLRDVLGAGHGAEARAKLGDGPTGRELRAAALEKAGGGCKKM
ncbi:cytochrome c family protein [Enhygromyxa salina]|uniref:Perchlorate reductase subunit gamma n=1 Tax=Enhygromyxa salina TaxID=215803 RepID=A0A2S9YJX0_9BACT|nr:cytochrome c family protein [Enhygromyxa salina]PRQ05397.1 Perchlorate reductase subunit gamma precursor [Enhygromyxa salina]